MQGYQFYWTLSQRPAVAEAREVKAITDRVDKDPQVLKVAKDIIAGKDNPKSQKKQKKNSFNNFEQRKYSDEEMKEIEKALLDLN